ncbi:MAG: ThiF family adenylyltransferase [Clostridium sp.]
MTDEEVLKYSNTLSDPQFALAAINKYREYGLPNSCILEYLHRFFNRYPIPTEALLLEENDTEVSLYGVRWGWDNQWNYEVMDRETYEQLTTINLSFTPQPVALSSDDLDRLNNSNIPINELVMDFFQNPYIVDDFTSRFSSAVWYEKVKQKNITLIGLGGIGSYVAFLLARMQPNTIYMMDDDIVEGGNISGQLYNKEQIGQFKASAMVETVSKYSDYKSCFSVVNRFTQESEPSNIMICGLDNMESRKVVFEAWLRHVNSKSEEDKKGCLFIDGRLAAESLQVFCLTGDNNEAISKYQRDYLFSSDEADETICSNKQTSYMANMIGSIIVNLFVNFVTNEVAPMLRDLPFMASYDADIMVFKTIG